MRTILQLIVFHRLADLLQCRFAILRASIRYSSKRTVHTENIGEVVVRAIDMFVLT